MSALTMRRRWLIARPWIKDTGIGLGFIAVSVASMWMLGQLAQWCQALGACA